MAYISREQVNDGIRGTSHAPVEATPPEPAQTISFFLIKHTEERGGEQGKA